MFLASRLKYCFVNGGAAAKCPCSSITSTYPNAAFISTGGGTVMTQSMTSSRPTDCHTITVAGTNAAQVVGVYEWALALPFTFAGICGYNPIYVQRIDDSLEKIC